MSPWEAFDEDGPYEFGSATYSEDSSWYSTQGNFTLYFYAKVVCNDDDLGWITSSTQEGTVTVTFRPPP